MSNVQDSKYAEDNVSKKLRIVNEYMLEKHKRVSIYGWAEVVKKLHDCGREQTLKKVPVCNQFVLNTGNESLLKNTFRKLLEFIEGARSRTVLDVYKRNVLGIFNN